MTHEAQATISLYVRLDTKQDMEMKEAVRASPDKYKSVADFVRVAITNQLKQERRRREREFKTECGAKCGAE